MDRWDAAGQKRWMDHSTMLLNVTCSSWTDMNTLNDPLALSDLTMLIYDQYQWPNTVTESTTITLHLHHTLLMYFFIDDEVFLISSMISFSHREPADGSTNSSCFIFRCLQYRWFWYCAIRTPYKHKETFTMTIPQWLCSLLDL